MIFHDVYTVQNLPSIDGFNNELETPSINRYYCTRDECSLFKLLFFVVSAWMLGNPQFTQHFVNIGIIFGCYEMCYLPDFFFNVHKVGCTL